MVDSRLRLAAACVTILVAGGCTPLDDALAGLFPGRSMRSQPSLGAYEAPMQPPANAVPFAAGNFPTSPGGVNTGQPEMSEIPAPVTPIQMIAPGPEVLEIPNPVEATGASLARGEVMFARTCSPCHGFQAAGDGTVAQFAPVLGVSLLTEQARDWTDGYIYSMIRIGRGAMPPYGHQVANYDRWHIVNYVRQLQAQAPAPAGAAPAADPAQE